VRNVSHCVEIGVQTARGEFMDPPGSNCFEVAP
jgi:hypothetical protein